MEYRITKAQLESIASYIATRSAPWTETNPLMQLVTEIARQPLAPSAVVTVPIVPTPEVAAAASSDPGKA